MESIVGQGKGGMGKGRSEVERLALLRLPHPERKAEERIRNVEASDGVWEKPSEQVGRRKGGGVRSA